MSNTEPPAEDGDSVSRLTGATLLLASTLTIMSGATISPALPAMRTAFSATPNADVLVQFALTIPALFIAVSAPVTGAVVDRLERTKLLFVSTGTESEQEFLR
jgi:MFS family permease